MAENDQWIVAYSLLELLSTSIERDEASEERALLGALLIADNIAEERAFRKWIVKSFSK